ncbi:uncharacterized protein LTR77_004255 [Saxophila tyrrhenica]|uniref:Uncharacterized protein n=1 Tax=Saxophila tyrrhenica TaxID=1690608 RepID=A0AAV9PD39_9PEZI|nr:hypothetical protein LTR77_004255 [Saxophila tyrrhenica]
MPSNTLRQPAQKRISLPSSQRLTTITESANTTPLEAPPPIPRRSSRRNSASHSESNSWRFSRRWSGSGSSRSERSAPPPPYEWVPEPLAADGSDEEPKVVDERLEKLRRGEGDGKKRRGGWVRVGAIFAVVVVIAVALGMGLGVGLKKSKGGGGEDENAEGSSGGDGSDMPPQKFPLGEYNGSTDDTSVASFNWIISNTSSIYATNDTTTTPSDGVPANLTVSSSNDPFGITFTDKALTYVSPSSNVTSAHYTFSFTSTRRIIPSPAITADSTNAECFFNQTIFTANIYLSTERKFPSSSTSIGGYEPWPYAVEITQTAAGGNDVPDCYSTVDGQEGEPVTADLVPQPEESECSCEYRNY